MVTGRLSAVERPLDTIQETPLTVLRDYWREAVAGRAVLPSAELRPERFAKALEHTALVERLESPRRGHRIRLCGADMENRDLGILRCSMLKIRAIFVLGPRHGLDAARLIDLCTREPARFRAHGSDGIEVRCTPDEARDPFTFLDWALGRLRG